MSHGLDIKCVSLGSLCFKWDFREAVSVCETVIATKVEGCMCTKYNGPGPTCQSDGSEPQQSSEKCTYK